MCPGKQIHIGSEQSPRSYRNGTGVDKDTVEVDEDTGPELHIEAVVHFDRGFDPGLVLELLVIGSLVDELWWKGCFVVGYAEGVSIVSR
jgi:hypothetical protein